MNTYCGSEFWNTSITWNADFPLFTRCFEQTTLVFIPCGFLWIFSLAELIYFRSSNDRNIPKNLLNVSKIIITAVLVIVTLCEFAYAAYNDGIIYPVDYSTPLIKTATFILAIILMHYNRIYGLRTSGVLFIFWLLFTLTSLPQLIRNIIQQSNDKNFNIISFSLTLFMLILNCFSDEPPVNTKYPLSAKSSPEISASFPSKLFFHWLDPLISLGFKRPLENADFWNVKPDDSSSTVATKFIKNYNKKVESQKSIVIPLIKTFGSTFFFGSGLKFISDLLLFVSPIVFSMLIEFVSENEPMWRGYLYASLLFITASIQTLFYAQYSQRMYEIGLRVRSALVSAIFRKALMLSNTAKQNSTVGKIVNLLTEDAQNLMDIVNYLNSFWSGPLQIALGIYLLWQILGASILAGIAVMIILIPLNTVIMTKVYGLQVVRMASKDSRIKLMNEILSGIKVLKLYAWEESFEKRVLNIRNKEINVLKKMSYIFAGSSLVFACSPFMISLVTFATFIMSSDKNVLTPTRAFVCLSLFDIVNGQLIQLQAISTYIIETIASVKRINEFMNAEELDSKNVQHDESEKNPLIIENGTFSWDDDKIILKNINMQIESQTLVAIVGSFGCGKSSVISAFLGEMQISSGRVNTIGKIAYVSQQSWIQNSTLRDNILFGSEMDKNKYNRVIYACALETDFQKMAEGDQTVIGEKGMNLSGGQKQRVALARAIYSDAEIYFFDDSLSAVDSHVGKHIFDNVIGPRGILANKVRVFVTNAVTYLPKCDKIFVLKDGEISEQGSYKELLNKKGEFANFLHQHAQDVDDNDEENTEDNHATDNEKLELNNADENEEKSIENEKTKTGSVKWAVYKHYLENIGWKSIIAMFFLSAIYQCFSIGSNVWLSEWSNDNTTVNDTERRNMYLGIYAAFGVGQALTMFVRTLTWFIGTLGAARSIHNSLLKRILRAPMEFFDQTPIGRLLNNFSNDIEGIDAELPSTLLTLLTITFVVFATLIVISASTPFFMIIILPIAIFYYLVQRFYVASSRQVKRIVSASFSPILSHFSESITGTSTIRAYNVEKRFTSEFENKVDFNQVCYLSTISLNQWLTIRLEMLGNLVILFAALFAVIGRDSLSPGIVGLSISYALSITQKLNSLVHTTSEVESDIVAVERISEHNETKQEAEWKNKVNLPANWPERGIIEFRDFQLRYRDDLDLVLRGINFKVNEGEKIGIVGRTGAGKSSLSLALFRLIESAGGQIFIDDQDIAKLGLQVLRSRLTIVPQDPVLFSGTLRSNLDPFESHSDEEIWQALENTNLKNFVNGLPASINHEIVDGGENLSAGQRQLMIIARALLRKTKILVLDEATAAIDLETDDFIQKIIRSEFKDSTVIIIAHRLNTIFDSDKVVVLNHGEIEEFASPKELLEDENSAFYSMARDANIVA